MSAGNDRARPLAWEDGLDVENSGRLDDSVSLPPSWPYDTRVDPLRLNGAERECWYSGWASGYNDGLERGQRVGGYLDGMREGWRRRVEHEYRAWESMARNVRELSKLRGLTYAEQHAPPSTYVPRSVPSYAECMASWARPLAVSA